MTQQLQPQQVTINPNEPAIIIKFASQGSVLFSVNCLNNVTESQFEIIGRELQEYASLLRAPRLKRQINVREEPK